MAALIWWLIRRDYKRLLPEEVFRSCQTAAWFVRSSTMDHPLASTPEPYDGLKVRSADVFPLTCTKCQRRFTHISDFIARTTPIFHSSGLMGREDDKGSFVLLLRNCLCGSSLALRCADRRNHSDHGHARRNRFDSLVSLLVETGVAPEQARLEVRRLLQETEV